MRTFFLPCIAAASLTLLCSCVTVAAPPKTPAQDADVQAIVKSVSAERLERTVRGLAAFPTRHTLSGEKGADAAAAWLAGQFEAISQQSGGRLKVEKQIWTQPAGTRISAPAQLTNVIAILPGSATPERVIVISGHYDSRVTDVMDTLKPAPGANDDASGVAVVMELARLLALSKKQFPATIVFAAVTGEEQGLYGSAHLAETMKAENRNVIAMLNNDIVGNSRGEDGARDEKHVRVFSAGYDPGLTPEALARQRAAGTDADTPARTLARATADATRRYVRDFGVLLMYRNDRYGRGGDHTPFLNNGYPYAVRLTETHEDWRHQHQDLLTKDGIVYGDLPEFVDYRYLAHVAQVNAATLADLAAAPLSPTNVRMKGDLSSQTTLSWDTSTGTDTAYYEVLIRPTNSPDWEKTLRFPTATGDRIQCTIAYSKDDYLFAVRAVGLSGARSLPGIPVAGR